MGSVTHRKARADQGRLHCPQDKLWCLDSQQKPPTFLRALDAEPTLRAALTHWLFYTLAVEHSLSHSLLPTCCTLIVIYLLLHTCGTLTVTHSFLPSHFCTLPFTHSLVQLSDSYSYTLVRHPILHICSYTITTHIYTCCVHLLLHTLTFLLLHTCCYTPSLAHY